MWIVRVFVSIGTILAERPELRIAGRGIGRLAKSLHRARAGKLAID
jgi:hypothetical protein